MKFFVLTIYPLTIGICKHLSTQMNNKHTTNTHTSKFDSSNLCSCWSISSSLAAMPSCEHFVKLFIASKIFNSTDHIVANKKTVVPVECRAMRTLLRFVLILFILFFFYLIKTMYQHWWLLVNWLNSLHTYTHKKKLYSLEMFFVCLWNLVV